MKIPNVSYLVKNVLDATFYVRDEYRELDAFVEEQRQSDIARRSRRTPILLTGQPGIGKTVYLTYCLVNRLAEGKPTVLSKSRSMRFAFLSSGVYSIPFDSFDDWVNPEVFAVIRGDLDGLSLFDLSSGESVNSLAPRWRTLVVSSPKPREVRKWVKENHVNKFYMKTWNWQEVYVSR
ncbi:uncharacterized protein EI90DRAFT_2913680 [Cantharellus anzutake]|uniref:uncharacterized protein n=1 Tax=Cantharellus anzutake TaxID=1750568 RepID=UPI001907D4F1|nr:uncharacterized protein EI90DRAFT_2913680 [Cantharellus anzutake]KAF8335451.1 hypothetical protein EI90DRAFT_2913680 [Cantharellus anzutake]